MMMTNTQTRPRAGAVGPAGVRGGKCIVVEDDPFWAAEISRALRDEAVEVLAAATGGQALSLARKYPEASIILDLVLPDIDGIEVLARLRSRERCPRVLAITGGGRVGTDFYLKLARQHGAAFGLAKPFTGEELLRRWKEVTRREGR